jgi:hypothetical protein
MKRFKTGVSAIVLLLAICASFAFRSTEEKKRASLTCTWYNYTGSEGGEYNPNNYVVAGSQPSCPGQYGPLCGVCVDAGDIYGTGEAFPGKPKVDDDWFPINNVVAYALLIGEDNYQEDFNEAAELKAP